MAPHALPDDRGLLVTIRQSTAGFSRIAVIGADGGEPREILEGTGARHVSSGHIVYTTADGTMWAAPFDLETLEAGRAEALWEDVLVHGSSYSQFAVSASGSLIYQRTPPPRDLEIGWVDRGGTFEALGPTWSHGFGFPSISPDGSSVTFARGGNQWVRRLDDSPPVQLTFEGGQNIHASWTPEGDSVVMDLDGGIQTRKADGSGQSVTTHRPADDRTAFAPVWAPDRSWLAYRTNANLAGSGDILAIRPGRDSLPTEIVASRAVEMTPSISPDGRWLAYNSDESGRHEVYVVPFPNSVDGKWKISDGGGMSPRWDRSGRELYYVSDRAMMAVPVRLEPSFGFGAAEALFPTADFAAGFALHPLYDVAPDGRFLLRRYLGEAREGPVVIVQDFAAELERRFSR